MSSTANDSIFARILGNRTAVAERLVQFETRKRYWHVGVKGLIDNSFGSIAARKLMYANKMGHGRTVRMLDEAGELQAIADDRDESRERPRQRRWPFSAPTYALKSLKSTQTAVISTQPAVIST